jgi:hypothetical protein
VLADERDEGDAERCGDEREEEERAQAVVEQLVQREAEQRTEDRPRGVRRTMEAERAPADLRVGVRGDERVARRRADPLADPVGEPRGENERPRSGEADQRL